MVAPSPSKPSLSKTASTSTAVPDLEILVRLDRAGRALTFELKASALGLNYHEFGPVELKQEPLAYFKEFFKRVDPAKGSSPSPTSLDPALAREMRDKLRRAGSYLTVELLPIDLQNELWEMQGEIHTVQLQSDESWIPWELLRLRSQRRGQQPRFGKFLCDAFDVTHWHRGLTIPPRLRNPPCLELRSIGVIAPRAPRTEFAEREVEYLFGLEREGYRVERIEARSLAILDALTSGTYDVLHFTGHGRGFASVDPDSSVIYGEDHEVFMPHDLSGEASGLGLRAPLVFLNACYTGRGGFSLTGDGGWAARFLQAGAGAFLGTHWAVSDERSYEFCVAFYESFFAGETLAAALRAARKEIRRKEDPTWLAYTAFSHPLLTCRRAGVQTETLEDSAVPDDDEPLPKPSPSGKEIRAEKPKTQTTKAKIAEKSEERPTDGNPVLLRSTTEQRPVSLPRKPSTSPDARRHEKTGILFVPVPEGTYRLGADDLESFAGPVHDVRLSAFWIARCPVTNEQYARFLGRSAGHPEPAFWRDPKFNAPEYPVVGVSWADARAFCQWAGLALPTEAQWEAAARGLDQRPYPWGHDAPNPLRACFAPIADGPETTDRVSRGEGPFGTVDQAGNVWEWCLDAWDAKAYKGRYLARNPVIERADKLRVVRGGSWMSPADELLAAHRTSGPAGRCFNNQGFRCVWVPENNG